MTYIINPCEVCTNKFGSDINNINKCLVETTAAFNQIPSNNAFSIKQDENWEKCMNNVKQKLGKNPEDLQLSESPVFVQAPHYIPELLKHTKNNKEALQICKEKCNKLRKQKNTCIENCNTDYLAIEKNIEENIEENIENYENIENNCNNCNKCNMNFSNFWFFIMFILSLILYILLIKWTK